MARIPYRIQVSSMAIHTFTSLIQVYSGEAAREGEAEQLESEVALD